MIKPNFSKNKVFVLLIILAFLIRAGIYFISSQGYFIQLAADDFYIFLELLDNWVKSGIISFDGESWTNGFHPLYLLILFPLGKLFGGLIGYEAIAIYLVSLFDVLTAVFIYKSVKLYYSEKTSKLVAYFWLFNPGTVFIMLMGTEAGLVGFMLSAFTFSYLKYKKSNSRSLLAIAGVSIVYALLFLTRTEFVLLGPIFWIDLFFHYKKKEKSNSSTLKNNFPRFLVSGLVIAALILPWFLYGAFFVGSPLQDSGSALTYLTHTNLRNDPGITTFVSKVVVFTSKYLLKVSNNVGSAALFGVLLALCLRNTLKFKEARTQGKTKWILGLLLALSVSVSFLIPEPSRGLSEDIIQISVIFMLFLISFVSSFLLLKNSKDNFPTFFKDNYFLIGFFVLHFLFYTWYFWIIQAWHIYSILFILTFLLVPSLFSYLEKKGLNIIIITIFLLLILKILVLYANPGMPWHLNHLEGASWLNQNTVEGTKIGATDAGIIAYFSERPTINLDGLVNRDAYLAMRENSLEQYILEEDIQYLFGNKIEHPDFEVVEVIDSNLEFPQNIWKRS